MNKKIFFIFLLLFIPIVSAESKFINSETKNNYTVDWYLTKDGIRNIEYDIYATNLKNEIRQINLSSIFEPELYRSQEIKNIKFLEYEEKTDANMGIIYYEWTESKPIFKDTNLQSKKEYYSTQTIGKLETKIYKLAFTVPLIKNEYSYGSKTKILLEINNEIYHPWLNISWFSRLYLYDINSYSSNTTIQISIDTRSLYLQQGIKEDCTDIRVTDGDNTELNYNLVSGCLTQNTTLNIEFTINQTSMYIYYNNENAGNVSNSSVVITDAGVPTTIIDYSSYGNDGINNGSIYGEGYDNETSLSFDGINDYINISSFSFNFLGEGLADWFNLSFPFKYEIINISILSTTIPYSINDNITVNNTPLWTLWGSGCIGTQDVYSTISGPTGSLLVANETTQCNWENSSILTGNNPTSLYNVDIVAWWHFDDGTNTNDSSRYFNNGTIQNGPTSTPGKIGNALLFDGDNDYILIDDNDSLDIGGNFSLSAWIYPINDSNMMIISKRDIVNARINYWLEFNSQKVRVGFHNTTDFIFLTSTNSISINEWTHVVGIWDNDTKVLSLYVNGSLFDTDTFTGAGSPPVDIAPLYIGTYNAGTGSFFNGSIDEPSIWNRTLSLTEIQQMYWNGIGNLTALGEEETNVSVLTGEFILSTWINLKSNTTNQTIFSIQDQTNILLKTDNNGRVIFYGGNYSFNATSTTVLNINTWYNISVSKNATNQTLLYINSILEAYTEPHNYDISSLTPSIGVNGTQTGDFCNCSLDEIRFYNDTGLILYYPVNITDTTPTFSLESQQYSPFFASEKTYNGVWNIIFTPPAKSSIYDIKVSLDDCNFNEFDIDTNTFRFYGNVTKFGFGVGSKWDACLTDKINTTTKCQVIFVKLDFGKTVFRYGYSGILPESWYTRYHSGENSHITRPLQFGKIDPDDTFGYDHWFLSYPKEFNFTSSCVDNDLTIKYQLDDSLDDVPIGEESRKLGALGYLSSLGSGMVGLLGNSMKIIAFGFVIVLFFMNNILLTFILFEIFAIIYSLRSTYTIAEFLGAYVDAHAKILDLIVKVLSLIIGFVQRVINTLANLIPFT